MKHIHTFESFVEETKVISLLEAIKENGLEFAVSHALDAALNFKSAQSYKDNVDHEPLFSLFHYEAGWPIAGLNANYFTKTPATQLSDVVKSAADYLRSGKASMPIIEFLAYLYTDAAPGGRSQGPIADAIKRIEPEFKPENKDLPAMQDALKRIIEVLKTWTTGTAAARLNLAVAVNKVCRHSGYSGADFTQVYGMIISGLRKNKIKLTADSKIEVNKDNTHIDNKTISNSIGFSQVDINRWHSAVTMKVDGTEYVVGSFENSSGYGRY